MAHIENEVMEVPQGGGVVSNTDTAGSQNQQDLCLDVAWFRSEQDNDVVQESPTWSELQKHLTTFRYRGSKLGSPCWSPTLYSPDTKRKKENVLALSCAVIDSDDGISSEAIEKLLLGYTYLIHSSYRHTPEHPKFRIILPLAVPVPSKDWPRMWHRIDHLVDGHNDPATKDASRIYFRPVCPPKANPFSKVVSGRLLDVNELPDPPNVSVERNVHVQRPSGELLRLAKSDGIEGCSELSPREGLVEMVARCAFMQWASDPEDQAAVIEPLWAAMISNACRFEGGEEWIHKASSVHPKYDEEATNKKIAHLAAFPSPITCQRIRELDFDDCPSGGCLIRSGSATKAPAGLVSWIYKTRTAPLAVSVASTISSTPRSVQLKTPSTVAGFIESTFPEGLVYLNTSFYGYQSGYFRRLQEIPDVANKAIVYLSGKASDEDLEKMSPQKVDRLIGLLRYYLAISDELVAPNKALICLANGTLDTSTYTLLSHSPEHCLMTKTDIDWNPEAQCSRWLEFIEEIFADDNDKQQKINFVQEWFGYCLVPDSSQHKFVWMIGSGGNGKSILLLILRKIVGEANVSDAAIDRLDRGPVRAELEGKLLNISSEISAEATIADGYLKSIVAGEPVEAERKYERSFTFRPHVRLIGATNSLPRLLDTTDGFARRAVILTFNRQFSGEECDPGLEEKLLNELPGIFVWAVEGLRRLRSRGKFDIPQSSMGALAQYRTESDPVALFVNECLEHSDSYRMSPAEIFNGFNAWSKENNHRPMSSINFGKRLAALGFEKQRAGGKDYWLAKMKEGCTIWNWASPPITLAISPLANKYLM